MIKKITFLVSICIILAVLWFFIREFKQPQPSQTALTTSTGNVKPDPKKPIATEVNSMEQTEFQQNLMSETLKLRPERPDLTKLNNKSCEKELNATLLLSYRLKKASFLFSAIYCLKNVYKYDKDLYFQFEKMAVAAAAHEKSYVFNGKTYDLSEESLSQ